MANYLLKHCNGCRLLKQSKERENGEAETSGRAVVHGHGKVVNRPSLEREHCEVDIPNSKAKTKNNAKSGAQKSDAESPNGLNAAGNCRYDSSLGLLTKKFVNLIMEAKDGTLDLNRTAEVLEAEIQSLCAEERRLDYYIRLMMITGSYLTLESASLACGTYRS